MSRKFEVAGPHNERMAALNQRVSGKEVFQIYAGRAEDPLKLLIDRYRRQARNTEEYNEEVLNEKIEPIDKLLEYNGRLAPVLVSLEKENNTLRGEISVLSHELRKSLDACESLIQENQEQKSIILNKNQDIRKIIETIALNETQMRGELEHKNYLLQQENSILIKHLEQIKIQKATWTTQLGNLEEELDKITQKYLATENHLEETLSREKELSKRVFLTDQSLSGVSNENSDLKQQLEDQKLENNKLKNQLQLVKVEDKTSLKDKFQVEIASIIQQYEVLKEERHSNIKNIQKHKLQGQHLESRVLSLERELQKAISNLQLTSSLLNQQKSKNASLQSANTKLQSRINQLKTNNESMRHEIQRAHNISTEKERMHQRQADGLRNQMEERNREVERKLKEIKQGAETEMLRKQREIEELRRNNEHLKSMVQRRN